MAAVFITLSSRKVRLGSRDLTFDIRPGTARGISNVQGQELEFRLTSSCNWSWSLAFRFKIAYSFLKGSNLPPRSGWGLRGGVPISIGSGGSNLDIWRLAGLSDSGPSGSGICWIASCCSGGPWR